jgi:hypothetical protein
MPTVYQQKTCLKCKNNHNEEGALCQLCVGAERRRQARRETAPENYWVECLIQREGDTIAHVGNIPYRFRHNEHGHSVCEVVNPGHYKQFTRKMGSFYRAYDPDEDYPEIAAEAERLDAERKETEKLYQEIKSDTPETSDDWPDPPKPVVNEQTAGEPPKEPGNDSAGTDNGQAGAQTGGNNSGNDGSGSGKRSGQGNRAGAGSQKV